ncbi:MotA/TolQ/ExbB proton channel family protein [Mariniflexile rhizosphaerae]|uniref:MotA/TolQ/ExbB proton channel family protein n=1 Tax=unclassified Mariniflexile TaxID=2643887 RepID=UPI000CC4C73C|nr:MotA/TolQ/ExbB proton channel family protein [Mariniflexile sp. TRM1-10]AXP81050.1 MotA/TolQ/ExbB proton channel family protein [Mariniflexile sp. TRM1-10]PLB18773.1 MAG: putative biopolymer transport protein [Flavobacteriaceae bacterium FS1-H7996/R]
MLDLFYEGGSLFMTILTILLLGVIVCFWKFPEWIKEVGLLALSFGILGQIIGLYGAFKGIEQMGQVSQEMMAGGLKVSSITTIYGLLIYIISLILRLINKPRLS